MPRYCQCGCNRKVRQPIDRFATESCKAKDTAIRDAARKLRRRSRAALDPGRILRRVGFRSFIVDGVDVTKLSPRDFAAA